VARCDEESQGLPSSFSQFSCPPFDSVFQTLLLKLTSLVPLPHPLGLRIEQLQAIFPSRNPQKKMCFPIGLSNLVFPPKIPVRFVIQNRTRSFPLRRPFPEKKILIGPCLHASRYFSPRLSEIIHSLLGRLVHLLDFSFFCFGMTQVVRPTLPLGCVLNVVELS